MLKPVSELDLVPLSEPTSAPLFDVPVYTVWQNLDAHKPMASHVFLHVLQQKQPVAHHVAATSVSGEVGC